MSSVITRKMSVCKNAFIKSSACVFWNNNIIDVLLEKNEHKFTKREILNKYNIRKKKRKRMTEWKGGEEKRGKGRELGGNTIKNTKLMKKK